MTQHFEAIFCAVLLMADAMADRDGVAITVAQRWVKLRLSSEPDMKVDDWDAEVDMDKKIFLGQTRLNDSAGERKGSKARL